MHPTASLSPFTNAAGQLPAKPSRKLARFNNLLLILVIAVNLYVISIPFLPQLLFQVGQHSGRQQELEQAIRTVPAGTVSPPGTSPGIPPSAPVNTPTATPSNQPNHVVIPAMLLDQPVIEGTNVYRALDQGIWRWPGGSTPDKGGNTVLVGHRFTYTKPKGVFYFLDKLHEGDSVGVVWDSKTYIYKVTGSRVVQPNQTSILNPTDEPTLTMYTCTPLWLPKDRLVITAVLEQPTEGIKP